MYTPTYTLVNLANQDDLNANFFMLNVNGPNFSRAIQTVVTQGTGSVSYTMYTTAFPCYGIIHGQPLQFDITNLKYWMTLGNAGSTTNQYIELPHASSGIWVIATISGNATLEYSILQPGLQ